MASLAKRKARNMGYHERMTKERMGKDLEAAQGDATKRPGNRTAALGGSKGKPSIRSQIEGSNIFGILGDSSAQTKETLPPTLLLSKKQRRDARRKSRAAGERVRPSFGAAPIAGGGAAPAPAPNNLQIVPYRKPPAHVVDREYGATPIAAPALAGSNELVIFQEKQLTACELVIEAAVLSGMALRVACDLTWLAAHTVPVFTAKLAWALIFE